MNTLEQMVAKLQGRNPDAEEAQKKRAQAGIDEHESQIGEKIPEEPGIEPDYSLEEAGSLLVAGPAASIVRKAGGLAAREGQKTLVSKLKEKTAPAAKKWSDLTDDERADFPGGFAAFIRKSEEAARNASARPSATSKDVSLDYSGWSHPPTRTRTDATTGFRSRKGILTIDK